MSETNGYASAEQLEAAAKRPRRYGVEKLPTSGLKVRFQSLKEGEISRYHMSVLSQRVGGFRKDRLEKASRALLVLCMVDGAGNRLYADADEYKLREWDGADTQFLHDKISAHCGINQDDIADLVKNSEQTPVDSSPSD